MGHITTPLFSAHLYCRHGRPSQLLLSSCSELLQVCLGLLKGETCENVKHDIYRPDVFPLVQLTVTNHRRETSKNVKCVEVCFSNSNNNITFEFLVSGQLW